VIATGWVFIFGLGCSDPGPKEKPVTIETVSQKITFDSVARMGPHHAIADISRERWSRGELVRSRTESIELDWNSWESFHFQRRVNGERTFEAIVHENTRASRGRSGPWRSDFDGEQARMDVYTSWNAWDEALPGFRERIGFEDMGATVVDGRDAHRFKLKLIPETKKKNKSSSRQFRPHRIEGEVVLDKATAVRLRVDVTAVEKKSEKTRKTTLRVRRSGIGETQTLNTPQVQLGTPGDLLKKLPKRPNPQ